MTLKTNVCILSDSQFTVFNIHRQKSDTINKHMKREKDSRTFLERLTGSIRMDKWKPNTSNEENNLDSSDELLEEVENELLEDDSYDNLELEQTSDSDLELDTESNDANLNVDISDDGRNLIIHAMVAGVSPDDLDVDIARDHVIIRGSRSEALTSYEGNTYYTQELYWGSFSRTISLPEEVEVEEAEAKESHGLLTIILPKVNKEKKAKVKVKSQ